MKALADKKELIRGLQQQILSMQGCHSVLDNSIPITGLGSLSRAFPQNTFPLGVVHEFLSYSSPDAAATNGFITGIVGQLVRQSGACLWISTRRTVFPPALKSFGIDPDRVVFIDVKCQRDALWTMEEALKCGGLAAVLGEFTEINFTASRRLQLAVENSRVTGFIHRFQPRDENTLACVSRWRVRPLSSLTDDGLPGVGFARWDVELLKVRNGKPGRWQMAWTGAGLRELNQRTAVTAMLSKEAV